MKKSGLIAALAAALCLLATPVFAQLDTTFAGGPDDDPTTSLGMYKIWVLPQWRPMLAGCAGFDPVTGIWNSTTLYDPATLVGRSDTLRDNPLPGFPDQVGVVTGLAFPVTVSDPMMPVRPNGPSPGVYDEGPANTKEIHTHVAAFNMTPGGGPGPPAIRGGSNLPGWPAPKANGVPTVSPGEIEAQPDVQPGHDFPAESFFDVYVEVDLPPCPGGFPGATIYNPKALVVEASGLDRLPPRVIYTHKNSSAVVMSFLNDGGPPPPLPSWKAGQTFGLMILAGHGQSYGLVDIFDFEEFMATVPEMPLVIPTATPYGMVALVLILIIAGASFVIWRKKRTATA